MYWTPHFFTFSIITIYNRLESKLDFNCGGHSKPFSRVAPVLMLLSGATRQRGRKRKKKAPLWGAQEASGWSQDTGQQDAMKWGGAGCKRVAETETQACFPAVARLTNVYWTSIIWQSPETQMGRKASHLNSCFRHERKTKVKNCSLIQ